MCPDHDLTACAPLSRRRFMAGAGGLLLAAALPGCSGGSAPVSIGTHIWPGYEPMILADAMGWMDGKPVRFVQTGSATETLALLEKGQIDGGGLTLDEVMRARDRGIDLTVILVCDISAGADVFLARPEIPMLPNIKGKRIGIEEGALGALMLAQALKAAGLSRSDIEIVPLAADKHVQAWIDGRIDAVATYEPASGHIRKLGAKVLFDSRAMPDMIIDVLAVRPSVLGRAHTETLRQLVAAHLRAVTYLDTNPADAAHRIAPRFKLEPAEAMSIFRGLILADVANNHRLLGTKNPGLHASIAALDSVLRTEGLLKAPVRLEGLVSADYLPPLR